MDAFETIRQTAADLHATITGASLTPMKPIQLVEAAIEHLEVELIWLPPSEASLKGARALFDDQMGAILAEDIGTTSDRALLIAHEIGHICVHDSASQCSACDIDATRSTEAAPVGLQRVEDYGAHERRELQANVFARELVFPRTLACRLYVTDELAARDIASQLDLPLPLVRQQILDAVLLPWTEKGEDKEQPPDQSPPEDRAQDRAAAHRGTPFQLEAGPGTGKTRTLVKRILSLLDEGIDPASILVLTFSNRAAGELAERVAAVSPGKAHHIWIGTFHAFGLDLVRRHYDLLDLPPDPALFDRSDAITVLEEILPTLPLIHYRNLWDPTLILKDVLGAISRAKDELVNFDAYRALAERMRDQAADEESILAAEKCLEIASIYERYEEAKSRHRAVDFGDLIMRPTLLLEREPALRSAVQLRHRHLLVDEYQDVNRASVRLVKAIAGDANRVWVVGDARQSIYRFRGASATNMTAFSEDFTGAQANQLDINYRSTQQVVNAFSALASYMSASEGMLPLDLKANRGSGPAPPDLRRFDDASAEAAGLAAAIRELESNGIPFRKQAVLCRTNARLNEIAAELEARDIPVLHLGSLFERDEVRDLLALMSLAVDPFGDALVRIAAFPRYNIALNDVSTALGFMKDTDGDALDQLKNLASVPGLSEQAVEAFTLLAKDLISLSRQSGAWDLLTTYLLDQTNIGRLTAQADSVTDKIRNVAVWQFLNFVREQPIVGRGLPIQRTLDRVRQMVLLAEERDLRQVPASALHMDAVRLMTVHGSKGLEFEAVHIPGLTEASFPQQYRGQRCPPPLGLIAGAEELGVSEETKRSHKQEEECLLFVAMSRARTYLRLYQQRFTAARRSRTPSKLLAKIPAQYLHETTDPPAISLPADALRLPLIAVKYPADWSETDRRLELYQKCPRRYFYTHLLGLGSARKTTAFSRTHDCIYEIVRMLAQERPSGDLTIEEVDVAFEEIWQNRGPTDHAFAADYRALASRLIVNLIESGAGRHFRETQQLAIDFTHGTVIVEPNELAELPDGTVLIRRIRTGYRTKTEYDGLEYTLYQLAGERHFSSGFSVEAVHLTDGIVEAVSVTARKIENRKDITNQILAGIASGEFPTNVDAVLCPRCPHFFICPVIPKGPLTLL